MNICFDKNLYARSAIFTLETKKKIVLMLYLVNKDNSEAILSSRSGVCRHMP